MKTFYTPSKSLAFILACCLTFPLFSQTNCQSIIPKINFSEPAITPVDTGWIDLCLGDTLKLTGEGIYPENDSTYHQSDSTSMFTWLLGDGNYKEGKSIQHIYTKPGAYYLRLMLTDLKGCKNDAPIIQRVRVAPKPDVQFANDLNTSWQFCNKDTIQVTFQRPPADTFTFAVASSNADTSLLPDGTGTFYESKIEVIDFPEQAVITSPQDLSSICLNIEHSWMRDLEVTLICPNGQSAVLHNFGGRIGGEIYLGEPVDFDSFNPTPGKGYDYCWKMGVTNDTWLEYANTFIIYTLPAGDYKPFESFDSLVGCPMNGEWTLKVEDLWVIDNGTIFGWNLSFLENTFGDENPETFVSKIENYQWLPNNAILQNTNDTLLIAVRDSIAPLILETTDNFGCTFQQEQTITTYPEGYLFCQPCDSLQIFITGDTIRCNKMNIVRARANVPDSILQYKWLDEQGLVLGVGNAFDLANKIPAFLEVRNRISGCMRRDTISITVASVAPIANAGQDQSICQLDSVLLDGRLSIPNTGVRYSWIGPRIVGSKVAASFWVRSAGTYILTVQDIISGCTGRDTVKVLPPPAFNVATTNAKCDTATGKAAILFQNEVPNYNIAWSTGETGDSIQDLAQGWYSVTVTSSGCSISKTFYVDEDRSCKVTISGYVYNSNTCQINTQTIGNIKLQLLPANIYTTTQSNGYYEFIVDAGVYEVKLVTSNNDIYSAVCPQNGIIQLDTLETSQTASNNNFFLQRIFKPNLKVEGSMTATQIGLDTRVNIKVCNVGNAPTDAVLQFVHDPLLLNKDLSLSANTYNRQTRTATWQLRNVKINECRLFPFDLTVSQNAPLNTILQSIVNAPLANDADTSNNRLILSSIVTEAFDVDDQQLPSTKNTSNDTVAIYFTYNKSNIIDIVENNDTKTTNVWNIGKQGAALRTSPNPTTNAISIEWNQPYSGKTSLTLYNANGQMIRQISIPQAYNSGTHQLNTNLENLDSGTYFLTLETAQERITNKVVKLK